MRLTTCALLALLASACGQSTSSNVHNSAEVKGKPCVQCHRAAYESAASPPHADLGQACETCHQTTHWSPSTFVHAWPLENKHAAQPCVGCHVGTPARYRGIPTVCSGCHQSDYDKTVKPAHAGLPNQCSTCHATTDWTPATFLHPWPLDGAHVTTACSGCHTGTPPRWAMTPSTCDGCHHDDYLKSTYPNHQTLPTACGDCHRTTAFKPALAPGHPEAAFPLTTGKHATSGVTCLGCHRLENGASTKGQNTDCVHCHIGSHQKPAIDLVSGHAGNAAYPKANPSVSFCLSCHAAGLR